MIDDFYVNNNKFSTMTNGVGSPRLLVIGDGEGSEEYIRKLASDNGFNVDTYKSEDSPS